MKRNSFKRTIARLGKCFSTDQLTIIKSWFDNVTHNYHAPIVLVLDSQGIQLHQQFNSFTLDFGSRVIDLNNWMEVERPTGSIVNILNPTMEALMKKNERISAEKMRRKQKRAERMKPRRLRRKRARRLELEHGRSMASKKSKKK